MSSGNAQIIFWDVKHGHATYIRTPNDRHIVIDLGTGSYKNGDVFSPLKWLKEKGVTQLDTVIVTHPHKDHIDDVFNFDALSPKTVYFPRQIKKSQYYEEKYKDVYNKYAEINDRYSLDVQSGSENDLDVAIQWGGLKITRFIQKHDAVYKNINNYSVVTVLEYARSKIVIPGDNEKESWEYLMTQNDFKEKVRDADIYLAAHHGRESGYIAEVVSLINPRLTVVSDGRFCETSANARYTQMSRGWSVWQNGQQKDRKCLTTNSDGSISVTLGYNGPNETNPFMQVSIQ